MDFPSSTEPVSLTALDADRLRPMIDAALGASLALDDCGRVVEWNSPLEYVFGWRSRQAVGRPLAELMLARADQESDRRKLERFLEKLPVPDERLPLIVSHRDGREFLVELSAQAGETDADRRRIDVRICDWQCLLDRVRSLEQARDAAEAAHRSKNRFLASISHDLRTPMSSIIGMTDLALEEELSPVVREYLETARVSVGTLLRLLDDILDLSRMESGRFDLDLAPFSLRKTLDDAVRALSVAASEKGLEIGCHVAGDVPDRLIGDPVRLAQVVTNLAGNAIKFTEVGEVAIEAVLKTRSAKQCTLRVTVSDTGPGIPPAEQKRIFSPFVQAERTDGRRIGGTGLGLAISKQLVRLMGGRLWVESEVGRGSRFHFTVRCPIHEEQPEAQTRPSPARRLAGMPVLAVDDNRITRRILYDALAGWGMEPNVVEDAQTALDLLRKAHAAGEPFPLVLVDAVMPGMDGLELVERLHEFANGSATTVLMISPSDRQMFGERCAEAPIDAFLQKPVSQSALLNVIMTVLGLAEPGRIAAEIGRAAPGRADTARLPAVRPLRILLAEDTPANQKVVMAILEKQGHTVAIADNGREAVECARGEDFDLVLMDVEMPTMDGYQATELIRAAEEPSGGDSDARRLPIIAMTAHVMQGDRERCLAAGMDDYLSKPIDADELIELVERFGGPGRHGPARGSEVEDVSEPVIDYEGSLARLGGDEELLQEMARLFAEDAPWLVGDLRSAFAGREREWFTRIAHSLKSLAANFGGHAAERAAEDAEIRGRRGSLSDAEPLVEAVEREFARLSDALAPIAAE